MKLYQIQLAYRYDHKSIFTFLVVASNIANAENIASDTFKKYDYGDSHVHNITVLAEEGQYGHPEVLLIEEKL